MQVNYKSIIVLCLLLGFVACKKEQPSDTTEDNPFDKGALLTNMSDALVIPTYSAMVVKCDSLVMAVNSFTTSPNESQLQQLRGVFSRTYMQYQTASIFGFGPAEDLNVRTNCNVFPTDTIKINNNIVKGTWNLDAATNTAAKGFPAIEFLLYGFNASSAQIISWYTNTNRTKYLVELTKSIQSVFQQINSEWKNTYRSSFTSQLGTDIGSPIGYLVNQLNFELDYLKNAKIATPVGLRSDGIPHPDNCEGFYAGKSVPFALATLDAIEMVYRGGQGIGFDDYLDHLGVTNGNDRLTVLITNQFTKCREKLSAIPDPMSSHVISDKAVLEAAYKELVQLLVYLKTDLPSALGVVITYQDGDGD